MVQDSDRRLPEPQASHSNSEQQRRQDASQGQRATMESAIFQLNSDVLSQIASQVTENVLQQLRATSLNSTTPAHASAITNPAPPPTTRNGSTAPPSLYQLPNTTPPPTKASNSAQGCPSSKGQRRPPTRRFTEITTLEKIWGPLFDGKNSTPRLGQFLRGLALQLIEHYEPRYSLVITPSTMQKYYEDTKVAPELCPWQAVFNDTTSSISRLYREVRAQHHLVQERLDERPRVPGLTPLGFERWCTLMLLAYPDQEFQRIEKAVLDMPICNFDDRKERFPKEVSRRLFPMMPDLTIRGNLEEAMITHCDITLEVRSKRSPQYSRQTPQINTHHNQPFG
jgi:hypothetical protein